jgi:hypothetical protein
MEGCHREAEGAVGQSLQTRIQQWGKRELERQLQGTSFERAVLSPAKVSPVVAQIHPEALGVPSGRLARLLRRVSRQRGPVEG